VDKLTRKDLKHDKFAEEVFDIFDWATENRDKVVRYGALALVVILISIGIYSYMRYQAGQRASALAQALRIDDASVGSNETPGVLNFPSQDEKEKAAVKAFTDVAAKYPGSDEGAIARLRLAGIASDKGNLEEAEKQYKQMIDSAPKPYKALARLGLAQVYSAQGKYADAEKILRDAVANAAETVSKEQATIALAQVLLKTNPAEAKKLVEPLRTSQRVAISQGAVTTWSDLPLELKVPEQQKPADQKKK
jgi:predicted negative regulator of RcsB-dependent stress response